MAMIEITKKDYDDIEAKMKNCIDNLQENLNTIRAGRANPHVRDKITVDYYGAPSPLNAVANIQVPEARMITLTTCGIFQLIEGVNMHPGDPNYDLFQLALKSTAKRLYPNYVNGNWSNDGTSEASEKEKQEIIDSLTDKQRQAIIEAIKKDPTIADRLGVKLEE